MKFFYNNFGIRAVIIYFCFVLIDLINDYNNILFFATMFMRWFFMKIDTLKIIFNMEKVL